MDVPNRLLMVGDPTFLPRRDAVPSVLYGVARVVEIGGSGDGVLLLGGSVVVPASAGRRA